ncbi:MAG: hypothetical protein ABI882_18065 [Acidobacteriota bacterium]
MTATETGPDVTRSVPGDGRQPCLNVPARFCGGLRNTPGKMRLSATQLNEVLLSLREKTGWESLNFDDEGFLICPDSDAFTGGSEAARRLLGKAIFSDESYYLEAHNRSDAVRFARLGPGTVYAQHGSSVRISVKPVQLDFADFNQLRGDGPALKAFDVGLAIMHELAHGIWQLRDAASEEDEPGECETFINQIRRELQLPERTNYLARVRHCAINCGRPIVELRFTRTLARTSEGHGRVTQRRYLLQWDATAVGAMTNVGLASLRVAAK